MLLVLTLGCVLEDCELHEESVASAALPFDEVDLLTVLEDYAPSRVVWDSGPSGSSEDALSFAIAKAGEGFVRQYRRGDGSECSGETQKEYLPVTVRSSIAEGHIQQDADVLLVAAGVELEDLRLAYTTGASFTDQTAAEVSSDFATACGAENPGTFETRPTSFWLTYEGSFDNLVIQVDAAGSDGAGMCWRGLVQP
jgi:hypothetical protein